MYSISWFEFFTLQLHVENSFLANSQCLSQLRAAESQTCSPVKVKSIDSTRVSHERANQYLGDAGSLLRIDRSDLYQGTRWEKVEKSTDYCYKSQPLVNDTNKFLTQIVIRETLDRYSFFIQQKERKNWRFETYTSKKHCFRYKKVI